MNRQRKRWASNPWLSILLVLGVVIVGIAALGNLDPARVVRGDSYLSPEDKSHCPTEITKSATVCAEANPCNYAFKIADSLSCPSQCEASSAPKSTQIQEGSCCTVEVSKSC